MQARMFVRPLSCALVIFVAAGCGCKSARGDPNREELKDKIYTGMRVIDAQDSRLWAFEVVLSGAPEVRPISHGVVQRGEMENILKARKSNAEHAEQLLQKAAAERRDAKIAVDLCERATTSSYGVFALHAAPGDGAVLLDTGVGDRVLVNLEKLTVHSVGRSASGTGPAWSTDGRLVAIDATDEAGRDGKRQSNQIVKVLDVKTGSTVAEWKMDNLIVHLEFVRSNEAVTAITRHDILMKTPSALFSAGAGHPLYRHEFAMNLCELESKNVLEAPIAPLADLNLRSPIFRIGESQEK